MKILYVYFNIKYENWLIMVDGRIYQSINKFNLK